MSKKIKIVKKVWGREEWIVNNDKYCGKILFIKKGFRTSLHYHKKKHETLFVLEGKIFLERDGKNKIMALRDVETIEQKIKHRLTALENSKLVEFSTHHEDSDSYREEIGGKVNLKKIIVC